MFKDVIAPHWFHGHTRFLVVPGGGHGTGGAYGWRRLQDFFVRHLQGSKPSDRNAPDSSQ